jgi:pimeloyl-ACP methyl ester carboxylesterase
MDQQGAHQLAMHLDNVQVDFIENAGHQLIFDNPQDVSRKIIFKHKKKKYYP